MTNNKTKVINAGAELSNVIGPQNWVDNYNGTSLIQAFFIEGSVVVMCKVEAKPNPQPHYRVDVWNTELECTSQTSETKEGAAVEFIARITAMSLGALPLSHMLYDLPSSIYEDVFNQNIYQITHHMRNLADNLIYQRQQHIKLDEEKSKI